MVLTAIRGRNRYSEAYSSVEMKRSTRKATPTSRADAPRVYTGGRAAAGSLSPYRDMNRLVGSSTAAVHRVRATPYLRLVPTAMMGQIPIAWISTMLLTMKVSIKIPVSFQN